MAEIELIKALKINEVDIEIRPKDGFINATQLCKAAGKEFKHYFENKSTKEFIEVAKEELNQEVVEVKMGKNGGSWVHRTIAIHLATWLSPEFYFKVLSIYDRWIKGDLTLAAEVVENYDKINDTTSKTIIVTEDNS